MDLQVLQSLKTTPFQAQSGDVITFDANGDISASYDIVTIQILSGHFRLVTVGSFTPGDASGHKILINSSQILWNDKFSQVGCVERSQRAANIWLVVVDHNVGHFPIHMRVPHYHRPKLQNKLP